MVAEIGKREELAEVIDVPVQVAGDENLIDVLERYDSASASGRGAKARSGSLQSK
jgi:hypothetical protein